MLAAVNSEREATTLLPQRKLHGRFPRNPCPRRALEVASILIKSLGVLTRSLFSTLLHLLEGRNQQVPGSLHSLKDPHTICLAKVVVQNVTRTLEKRDKVRRRPRGHQLPQDPEKPRNHLPESNSSLRVEQPKRTNVVKIRKRSRSRGLQ